MTSDLAVLVGRFQPFHNAHLELLTRALAIAPRVVVVVGSAFQARTPKNPFTWTERAEMIRLALPEADRARVRFLPVRDYYDQARWVRVVSESIVANDGHGNKAAATGDSPANDPELIVLGTLPLVGSSGSASP